MSKSFQLSTLKAELPWGSQRKIAEMAGVSFGYVNLILNEKVPIRSLNSLKVITAMKEIIAEFKNTLS
jgi:transcriptional regulator with XRE-family HTH domain